MSASNSWREKLKTIQNPTGEKREVFSEEKQKEMQSFVESLSPADLPTAVEELENLQSANPTPYGRDLRLRLLRLWAESDVHAAADWIPSMPPGEQRGEVLNAIAGSWARKNFAEAATWAAQWPNEAERQKAQESIVAETIYSDPIPALKLAITLPASEQRDLMIAQASGTWAVKSPQEVLEWAGGIADQTLQQQIFSMTTMSWADKDPIAAGTFAVESMAPGEPQNQAVIGILQRWMNSDAPAAREWADQFPQGKLREAAWETVKSCDARAKLHETIRAQARADTLQQSP